MSREKTLDDMRDNLTRMEALESHAKMFCKDYTRLFVMIAMQDLRHAIEIEEASK